MSYKKHEQPALIYFLMGQGLGKIIVLIFMISTVVMIVVNPTFLQRAVIEEQVTTEYSTVISTKLDRVITNTNETNQALNALNETSSLYSWFLGVIVFLGLLIAWGLYYGVKKNKSDVVATSIFSVGAGAIALSFTMIKIDNFSPGISLFKDEYIYLNVDKVRQKKPELEKVKTITVNYIGEIGPFVEAEITAGDIESDLKRFINAKAVEGKVITNFIIVGIADKRPLSSTAGARWGTNMQLAKARAEKVKKVLFKVLGTPQFIKHQEASIMVVPYGPTNTGNGINEEQLAKDRRVDIYAGYSG